MENPNLLNILEHVDPAYLDYTEWLNVGMALHHEGYTAADWDAWSKRDPKRYHAGECWQKWATFNGSSTPVTAGTIVQLAKDQGWSPAQDSRELDWDEEISISEERVVINHNWLEGRDVIEPDEWDPVAHLTKYLETLFEAGENVGYVTESWWDEKTERYLPKKGCSDRTAGELIQQLSQCNGDIGAVLGDYKPEVGAWIRFNPLDGKGVKDANVTEYRYALVEADADENENEIPIDKQHAMIRELELPVACLVHSGKKSLHAIIRIDATSYEEYRKRVDFLYDVCKKNGFYIDKQNRNPSRLSRMPGVIRDGHKQFLIDTNIGKSSWDEWKEWIEAVNDDLPEPESLSAVWDNMPELSPPLIDGVLRQGHKLLMAGPSKAGKSFALIELCIAIAEGKKWMGWNCTQGKVMYVNLELDRASCLHRFKDVYEQLGWAPQNIDNIKIWNLRGKSVPMDKLAPKLIRRAAKRDFIAVVIDPIYKVITGDENSADQMAAFCNQFDKVCTELGVAVIYCHHHSKGAQGGKRSMDRASGSGVFARDPDALLDLIELDLTEALIKQEINKSVCKVAEKWLIKQGKVNEVSQDDLCNQNQLLPLCEELLDAESYKDMLKAVSAAEEGAKRRTAWRIEGTLREFPKFAPVNIWFDYPVHYLDQVGSLKDIEPEKEQTAWKKNFSKKKNTKDREAERKESLETAFEACGINGEVTTIAIAEYLGVTEKTVRRRIKEHGGFWIDGGNVGKKT